MSKTIWATVIFFLFCSPTWAWWPTVKDYKESKSAGEMRLYIVGVGFGFQILNVGMGRECAKRVFCPPPKLAITKENFLRILDDEIKRQEESSGYDAVQKEPVEFILLEGLKNTFPCK